MPTSNPRHVHGPAYALDEQPGAAFAGAVQARDTQGRYQAPPTAATDALIDERARHWLGYSDLGRATLKHADDAAEKPVQAITATTATTATTAITAAGEHLAWTPDRRRALLNGSALGRQILAEEEAARRAER